MERGKREGREREEERSKRASGVCATQWSNSP